MREITGWPTLARAVFTHPEAASGLFNAVDPWLGSRGGCTRFSLALEVPLAAQVSTWPRERGRCCGLLPAAGLLENNLN